MNASRDELILALALTKAGAERSAFLDRECAGDPASRARLEALLAGPGQQETRFATHSDAALCTVELDPADGRHAAEINAAFAALAEDNLARATDLLNRQRPKDGRDDGVVEPWNLASTSRLASWRAHESNVVTTTFSPDGRLIATVGDDRKVKPWNIATRQEVTTLEVPGGCRSVGCSPDGRILAVGYIVGFEVNIRLWEVPSFDEIDAAEAKQPRP